MTLVLGFDTSAAHVSAALFDGTTVIAARTEDMARGQAERLMPLLQEVLAQGGAHWSDLARLAVGIGPGNFTGIRISVATARGLALGLGIPAVGVSLFDTTQVLANWAQVAVPGPRRQAYVMDFDRQSAPHLSPEVPPAYALSSAHAPADHIATMARIAASRPGDVPPPAPLYVKPADAAPSRDAPPVILP